MLIPRRLRAYGSVALAAVIGLALPTVAMAPPANAEAYRYWGYYHWEDGQWTFAQTGPDAYTPDDGAVEGWRFAVSDENTAKFPRAAGDFEQICGSTEPTAGQKRVALIIDYGSVEEAPEGEEPAAPRGACATVDVNANGAQVLAEVASARLDGAMVCGLDGYPATGCGDPVATPPPPGSEEAVQLALPEPTPAAAEATDKGAAEAAVESADGGAPVGLLAGIGGIAAIGLAAALLARRSRQS